MALFSLGHIVATPGAIASLNVSQMLLCLARHHQGDWGMVCAEDKKANNRALVEGTRLLSAYEVDGQKIWIITEADRSVTTVLLPEEY